MKHRNNDDISMTLVEMSSLFLFDAKYLEVMYTI